MSDQFVGEKSLQRFRQLFTSVENKRQQRVKHAQQTRKCQEEYRDLSKLFNQNKTHDTVMTPKMVMWLSQPVVALEEYLCDEHAVMILNFLDKFEVRTVGELLEMSYKGIMAWENWGETRMEALYEALEKIGFIRYST
jgi:DNA-directed RNA polymerase alpha subunit